jgi:SAM-dependent methyltransferase
VANIVGHTDMMNEGRYEAFRLHYESEESDWGGHSGEGSRPQWNIDYRVFLERFIKMNNIRSVVDIGCGDWQFSRFIDFSAVRYYGFDVVKSVVKRNKLLFESESVTFHEMPDILDNIPTADLLIMKDVLQHLPDSDIEHYKINLFNRFPKCLISNSYEKIDTPKNIDIESGGFRCLDLNDVPYLFNGTYVLEFWTPLWERIRTMLYVCERS